MNNSDGWTIVLCPGFHAPDLTRSFVEQLASINLPASKLLIFPSDRYPAYSTPEMLRFLHERLHGRSPARSAVSVTFIGFSAGAVGAMGAALAWEALGGDVRALFALDGWGVPTLGTFPTHRISHDYFTYWSSALLGAGHDSFYAEPGVEHLDLWRSPQRVQGWWVPPHAQPPVQITLLQFLAHWLQHYNPI